MEKIKRKRILLVDIGAPFGGVETYIQSLAGILTPEADVFAICGLPELASSLRYLGVHVLCIPFLGGRFHNLLRFLLTALVFPAFVLRHRIDVVQVNGYLESLLVLPARMLGCFAIRTSHGPTEVELYKWYRQPTKYFPRLASRFFLRFASRVVCVSKVVGMQTLKTVPPRKVVIIPNWIERLPRERIDRGFHRPLNILYVGRLERYKGLHLLIDAMSGMDGLRLTVLGDGKYRSELEKLAAPLDARFEGFSANTPNFYEDADIFVNPSLGPEGLPIVSLEAMSYGLPCIFSSLPVHAEISDNGTTALLFEVGNVTDLRSKLIAAVNDPGMRSRLAANARAIVKAKYSLENAREAYLKAFEIRGSI